MKPEGIEESKLEWGPELGRMSLDDAQAKIVELNARLVEGEKPWRLPTAEELEAEFNKTGKTPAGFESDYYWSGTTIPFDSRLDSLDNKGDTYIVDMNIGDVDRDNNMVNYYVRLVRDAA